MSNLDMKLISIHLFKTLFGLLPRSKYGSNMKIVVQILPSDTSAHRYKDRSQGHTDSKEDYYVHMPKRKTFFQVHLVILLRDSICRIHAQNHVKNPSLQSSVSVLDCKSVYFESAS